MTLFKKKALVFLLPLFALHCAQAQTGKVFSNAGSGGNFASPYGEPTIGSSHIYVLGLSTDPRFSGAKSLVDCSLVGVSGYNVYSDSNSDCYVLADSSGNFGLTGTFHQSCSAGSQIVYFEAVGGTVGGTSNPSLALLAVPPSEYTCGYIYTNSSSISLNISDFTNVAAAFTAGAFAEYDTGTMYDVLATPYTLPNDAAVGVTFDAANNVVPISTGVYGGTNTTVQYQLNTVADVIASCIDGSSTDCSTLFSNTAQGNFYFTAPANTWQAMLSMAQYPTNNVSNQYSLITSTPPWAPFYSSAPSTWAITQASLTPIITGITPVGGPGNTYVISGTNIVDCVNSINPTVAFNGHNATVTAVGCTTTSPTVTVITGAPGNHVVGLFLEGDFSNMVFPF